MDRPFKISYSYRISMNPFYNTFNRTVVEQELQALARTDERVDQMTEYLEAEEIIKSIQEKLK